MSQGPERHFNWGMTKPSPLLYLFLIAPLVSCDSGVGVQAPQRRDPTAQNCDEKKPQLAQIRTVLDSGMLAPLGPMIDEVLFEQGAFRPAGELALTLARQLDPNTFPLLLQNYNAGEGLARLSPTVFQLLQYTDADNLQTPADNHGLWAFGGRVLQTCPAHDMLGAVRAALSLNYVTDEGTQTPWLQVLLDKAGVLLADPSLPELLARFELEGDFVGDAGPAAEGEGQLLLGRDAFRVIMTLIAGNLTSPDLDTVSFRSTVDDLVLPQLAETPALQAQVTELMDLAFYALDSDPAFLGYLQTTVACLVTQDPDSIFAHFVYDALTFSFIEFDETVAAANAIDEDPAGEALFSSFEILLDVLFANDYLARDLFRSVSGFLTVEHASVWAPTLLQLQGKGVVSDLTDVVSFFFGTCTSSGSE